MAVVLRLKRIGANNRPSYRIVAADSRFATDGRILEVVGQYDPKTNPPKVVLKEDRIQYWLKTGSKPSPTVSSLIKKFGTKVKEVNQ